MRKVLAGLVVAGLLAATAQADLLLRFPFTDDSPAADMVASGLSVGNIGATAHDGEAATLNFASFTDFSGIAPENDSGGVHGWLRADTFTMAQGDETSQGFLGFTITPDAGFSVSLTSLGLAHRMGANCPTTLAVGIGSAGPGDWDTIATGIGGGNDSWDTATLNYEGAVDEAVEVRIYGWGGTNPGGGQFRFDDIQVFGSVIPEPGTMGLLVIGFAGIVAIARRRRT